MPPSIHLSAQCHLIDHTHTHTLYLPTSTLISSEIHFYSSHSSYTHFWTAYLRPAHAHRSGKLPLLLFHFRAAHRWIKIRGAVCGTWIVAGLEFSELR